MFFGEPNENKSRDELAGAIQSGRERQGAAGSGRERQGAAGSGRERRGSRIYALFIRNVVLDSLRFKKILELQGKSRENFEISVPSFTVSETRFFLRGFRSDTTRCFMCKPKSTAK